MSQALNIYAVYESYDVAKAMNPECDIFTNSEGKFRAIIDPVTSHFANGWKLVKQTPQTKEVEWDGEGLPPIGVECEIRFRGEGEWTDWFSNGKLKAGYDSKLWFSHDFGECVYPAHDVEFRRPETPEARKEREELENGEALFNFSEESAEKAGGIMLSIPWEEQSQSSKDYWVMFAKQLGYRVGK